MDRPIITLPPFQVTQVDWDIDWAEQSAGRRLSGRGKIQVGDFPRWIGSPKYRIRQSEIGRWRANRWAGQGLTGVYRVAMSDPWVFPCKVTSIPFSDDTYFEDGAGFYGVPTVRAVGSFAAGSTEIVVDESDAAKPSRIGQIMSHEDYPFAVIERFGSGAAVSLTVAMPLRSAIADGDLIRMVGTGLFELTESGSGNITYPDSRVVQPSMQFREWLR